MDAVRNEEVVRRFLEQALGTSNLDLADELLAEEYVTHGPTAAEDIFDREAAKQLVAELFAAFPDLRVTVDEVLAEGDRVIARYTLYGTHLGVFRGVPPSGQVVTARGITWYRLREGRIAEDWTGASVPGLLMTVGSAPS